MPGLLYSVNHWEILNEPDPSDPFWLGFLVGEEKEYFDILKNSYEAIKQADSNAVIFHAGGYQRSYWQSIYSMGGKNYFDVANFHMIRSNIKYLLNTCTSLAKFLKDNQITHWWMSEFGVDGSIDQPDEVAINTLKGNVIALAHGAEKTFHAVYKAPPSIFMSMEQFMVTAMIDGNDNPKPLFHTMKTMMEKIDAFSEVQIISDTEYKFIVNDKPVYVVWESNELPVEFAKNKSLKLTNYLGRTYNIKSEDFKFSLWIS